MADDLSLHTGQTFHQVYGKRKKKKLDEVFYNLVTAQTIEPNSDQSGLVNMCSYSPTSSSVGSALSLTLPIYLSWHVPGREERKRMERG